MQMEKSTGVLEDLKFLRNKVDIYYENNDVYPLGAEIVGDIKSELGSNINVNDGDKYYKIDYELLGGVSLISGQEKYDKDYYIINKESGNIYYYAGVELTGKTIYTIKQFPQNMDNVTFGVQEFEFKYTPKITTVNKKEDVQIEVIVDIPSEGIVGYQFKIDDNNWTTTKIENNHLFNQLDKDKEYKIAVKVVDTNGNEIYATNNGVTVIVTDSDADSTVIPNLVSTYKKPIIPKGFTPIHEGRAVWESSDGYKYGLVIEDKSGNQFVWVPIEDTTGFEQSIIDNGGFYISRYEIGKETIETVETVVSKRDATVWNNIAYVTAKAKAENMYANVNETLIYDKHWDATLNFIKAYGGNEGYITDSTGLGNYSGTIAVAGSNDVYSQKNIYDMAGNVAEYVQTSAGNVIRGGRFNENSGTSPAENSTTIAAGDYSYVGFRVAIYL